MAIPFAGIRNLTFRGATARYPVKLPQGVSVPPNQVPPSVCPIEINWVVYSALANGASSISVDVNLQAASVQASILDRIASVKIDNSGSANPIYVYFPDTNDTISCPPNTTVTFPCLTNLLTCKVIAIGLLPNNLPLTRIFFYNSFLPPAVDPEVNNALALWKASPTILRDNYLFGTAYGTPALGDQYFESGQLNLAAFSNIQLWGTPYVEGFIYLQSLYISLVGIQGPPNNGQIRISTDTGTILMLPSFYATGTIPAGQIPLVEMSGMNVKLDATKSWRIYCTVAVLQGVAHLHTSYTKANV